MADDHESSYEHRDRKSLSAMHVLVSHHPFKRHSDVLVEDFMLSVSL